MIFITVGTHEQQFNRLIKYIDKLKENGTIEEEVIIQIGFSTYKPQYCKWEEFISYTKMERYINEARIVITHGGPASFIMPLQIGKIPVVVPRKVEFKEHVNNHQVDFVKSIQKGNINILPVYNIETLAEIIENYESIISKFKDTFQSNNINFCNKVNSIVNELICD